MNSIFDILSIMKSSSSKESGKHVSFEYDTYSSEDTSNSSFFQQRGSKSSNRDDS